MIEKVKAFWSNILVIIGGIIAPVALIVGYVFYLLGQKRKLETELEGSKQNVKNKENELEQERVSNEADNTVRDYTELRDKYLSEQESSKD